MARGEFKTYEEFWPHYLSEHSRPATRWLHAAGTLAGLALLIFFAATARWAWLPLALVPGYGFAWVGHFFVERNRPATFAHPWWSFVSDFRMIWLLATGRLGRHTHALK